MKIPQHPGIVCRDFVQREGLMRQLLCSKSICDICCWAYGLPTIPFSLPSIPEAPGPIQLPLEDGSGVGWNGGG